MSGPPTDTEPKLQVVDRLSRPPADGRAAVVTGAAGGMGSRFASQLAGQGYDLILIDRRIEPLQTLRQSLQDQYHGAVEAMIADLSRSDEVRRVCDRLAARTDIEVLINNAGFGHERPFCEITMEEHLEMVSVHVLATNGLVRATLPQMITRNHGSIVNVGSVGAWLPAPRNVQYAATKNYLIAFSESLSEELRDTGVHVQALCPAFVRTGYHSTAAMAHNRRGQVPTWFWQQPEEVVACSLKHLRGGPVVLVPGWKARVFSRLLRALALQPIVRPVSRALMRKYM
jgi:hypothetical protein